MFAPAGEAASLSTVGIFDHPVYVSSGPDDPDRLFVVEQAGEVELVDPSGTTTFLDIEDLVLFGGEQGLLSIAFAPDFAASGLVYAYYVNNAGDLEIDEFRAAGDAVDPASRREVLTIPHPGHGNHNGGQLQFGPDGFLYAATGDGGGGGDPGENAQNLDSLLGKLLRIDPRQAGSAPYTVPADNPFLGAATDPPGGARDEIWSFGLRNPWRFSFDRHTGDLLIADVGDGSWEEIDFRPLAVGGGRGENFGWDCREGAHDFELAGCTGPFVDPIFEYPHSGPPPSGCSITGGYVVRDPSIPELLGRYVYADFCAGQLRSLTPSLALASDERAEGLSAPNPTSFGEDACGRVYVATIGGTVSRLVGDGGGDGCVTRALTVSLAGEGSGIAVGPGIECPGDCSQRFFDGRTIVLTATPAAGSRFVRWEGDCDGAGQCALLFAADRAVTARFERKAKTDLDLSIGKRRIRSGERVPLRVSASPCPARGGDRIELRRAKHVLDHARLGADRCRARFRVRPRRSATYRVSIGEDDLHLAAESKRLRIRAGRR